jgi:putative peptide zinc metalloprotease protein
VLYTDVSEAWRLPAIERAIVDIGGIYYQSLFILAFIFLYALNGTMTWAYAVVVIDFSIALSLNPFLRMDGYWLAADLFGIWNLRALSIQTMRHFWLWLRGKPRAARSPLAQFGMGTGTMVVLYSALSGGFFTWLTIAVGYQAIFVLGPAYPAMVANALHTVETHPPGIAAILEVGWKSMLFVGCFLFLWRRLRSLKVYCEARIRAWRGMEC